MDSVIDGAIRLTKGAQALNMPVLVTGGVIHSANAPIAMSITCAVEWQSEAFS